MENETSEDNCHCPMECNSITYSSYYVSTPFDPQKICKRHRNGLLEDIFKHEFPPKFLKNLLKYVNNDSNKDTDICKKHLQYRAEVSFQLSTNAMSVTVISRRLSFFDKLSGFGKPTIAMSIFV